MYTYFKIIINFSVVFFLISVCKNLIPKSLFMHLITYKVFIFADTIFPVVFKLISYGRKFHFFKKILKN